MWREHLVKGEDSRPWAKGPHSGHTSCPERRVHPPALNELVPKPIPLLDFRPWLGERIEYTYQPRNPSGHYNVVHLGTPRLRQAIARSQVRDMVHRMDSTDRPHMRGGGGNLARWRHVASDPTRSMTNLCSWSRTPATEPSSHGLSGAQALPPRVAVKMLALMTTGSSKPLAASTRRLLPNVAGCTHEGTAPPDSA